MEAIEATNLQYQHELESRKPDGRSPSSEATRVIARCQTWDTTAVTRAFLIALLLPLGVLTGTEARGYDPAALVASAKGDLPLILTVPHDGGKFIGFVAARGTGTSLRDSGTRALAERTARFIEQRTGRRPYLVVAEFSRKFADANRAEQEAVESPDALPAYRAYHDQIAAFIAEIRSRFPAGALLIDVHGQGAQPDTIFRGTRAGLTTRRLLARFGRPALQGETSIIGGLAAKGYVVNPTVDAESLREDSRFSGGHTVFTYGSNRSGGIDAVQLEFGSQLRAKPELAEHLAEALVTFMTQHDMLPR